VIIPELTEALDTHGLPQAVEVDSGYKPLGKRITSRMIVGYKKHLGNLILLHYPEGKHVAVNNPEGKSLLKKELLTRMHAEATIAAKQGAQRLINIYAADPKDFIEKLGYEWREDREERIELLTKYLKLKPDMHRRIGLNTALLTEKAMKEA